MGAVKDVPLLYYDPSAGWDCGVTAEPLQGCELVLCPPDTLCQLVAACASCPAEATCIPIAKRDTRFHQKCQRLNYTQAILLDRKTCYGQIDCTEADPTCPNGAVCVETYNGKGLCCRDQASTYGQGRFRKEKPGVCPENLLICGGVMCDKDVNCTGYQKCCSSCGSKICADPVVQCGNSQCKPGEICVPKQRVCPPGMACIQALIDTCVPEGCAKCAYNDICNETSSGYECIPPPVTDLCGGCPKGQTCVEQLFTCDIGVCSRYTCVNEK